MLNSFLQFVEAEELIRNALNVFTTNGDDWAEVRRACDALSYAEITRACTEAAKATILVLLRLHRPNSCHCSRRGPFR